MKRAPDNILQWNDLDRYPAMRANTRMSRGWRIFLILAALAIVVGALAGSAWA